MEIPQKANSRSTIRPSYALLGISPKGLISTDACVAMLIATRCTKDRKWKEPKHLSIDEWMVKIYCVSTMDTIRL